MALAISIFGTIAALLAVSLSLWVAPALREISTRSREYSAGELRGASVKVWTSLGFGTAAGMVQAWEGSTLVALVWVFFAAVQCANLGALRPHRPPPTG